MTMDIHELSMTTHGMAIHGLSADVHDNARMEDGGEDKRTTPFQTSFLINRTPQKHFEELQIAL